MNWEKFLTCENELLREACKSALRLNENPVIAGNLILAYSPIKELPLGLKVQGDLSLYRTKNLIQLPEGLIVHGSLYLRESSVKILPAGLQVGELDLFNTVVEEIGPGLTVKEKFNLFNSKMRFLPEKLWVGGDLDLAYTSITKFPEEYFIGGDIYSSRIEYFLLKIDQTKIKGQIKVI